MTLRGGTIYLRLHSMGAGIGNRLLNARHILGWPHLPEHVPGLFLTPAIQIRPDNFQNFDFCVPQSIQRLGFRGSLETGLASASLEVGKLLGGEAGAKRLNHMIVVGLKLCTDVQHPAMFKSQNRGGEKIELAGQKSIDTIYGGRVIGPDFHPAVEVGIGGGKRAGAAQPAQHVRGPAQRVNHIGHEAVGITFDLKSCYRPHLFQGDAHHVQINCRRIGGHNQLLLPPVDACVAIAFCQSTFALRPHCHHYTLGSATCEFSASLVAKVLLPNGRRDVKNGADNRQNYYWRAVVGSHYGTDDTVSTWFRNATFFSAGRNDASNELRAISRNCSFVKPNASCASWYSRPREVPKMPGSSELMVTITPVSKYIFSGCSCRVRQQPVRRLLVMDISTGICRCTSSAISSRSYQA